MHLKTQSEVLHCCHFRRGLRDAVSPITDRTKGPVNQSNVSSPLQSDVKYDKDMHQA